MYIKEGILVVISFLLTIGLFFFGAVLAVIKLAVSVLLGFFAVMVTIFVIIKETAQNRRGK